MSESATVQRLRAKLKQSEQEKGDLQTILQDMEERGGGPADIEGAYGRVAVLIGRDKGMAELKRLVDLLPSIPFLRPESDPDGEPLGFRRALFYGQSQVAKFMDSLYAGPAYTKQMVQDRHRARMFLHLRIGFMLRDDVIGESTRADFLNIVERVVYAPSVPIVFQQSAETPVEPTEAPRKGFG